MLCSVILAGGAGTRLWPLSSAERPKQFLKLFSDKSMIWETSSQVLELSPIDHQYVLTGECYRELVEREFGDGIHILAEPQAKNTGPCILWAARRIARDFGGQTVMLVMPSDHVIADREAFMEALQTAIRCAEQGNIVTFGILPSRPETGYGYIEIENPEYVPNKTAQKVLRFREKPDRQTAEEYVGAGNYLWNSGRFVFRADTIISEFEKYAPEVYNCFGNIDVDNTHEVAEAFSKTPSISIDYAVMEHTEKAMCVPSQFGWNDVGGYQSLHDESKKDENHNVFKSDVIARNTTNCYVYGEKRIVCVGLDDMVVVESGDTILIARKGMSEQIGEIAKSINNKG